MLFTLMRYVIINGQVVRCPVTFKDLGEEGGYYVESINFNEESVLHLVKQSEIDMLEESVTYFEWMKVIEEERQNALETQAVLKYS